MNTHFITFIPDPALQADAFRGRSAEPPRRRLLRGLITPFFRRSHRLPLFLLKFLQSPKNEINHFHFKNNTSSMHFILHFLHCLYFFKSSAIFSSKASWYPAFPTRFISVTKSFTPGWLILFNFPRRSPSSTEDNESV